MKVGFFYFFLFFIQFLAIAVILSSVLFKTNQNSIYRREFVGLASLRPIKRHAFKFHGNRGLSSKESSLYLATSL